MSFFDFLLQEWLLVTVFAATVAAFFTLEARRGGRVVSHHELTRLLNQEQAVVLDVRDAQEFQRGHIAGAVNIPYAALAGRATELTKYQSKQIVVADKMGQHAGAAGRLLRERGYNAARLSGGISEWTHQNLPLVKA